MSLKLALIAALLTAAPVGVASGTVLGWGDYSCGRWFEEHPPGIRG